MAANSPQIAVIARAMAQGAHAAMQEMNSLTWRLMRLLRRSALITALAASAVVGAWSSAQALRDRVPPPRLRPAYLGASLANPGAVVARQNVAISSTSRFTREEQITLARISQNFNSFRLMEGQFIQFGPSGEQSEGVFFLSKPGRIRFHYRPPVRLDIIADGSTVAIKNNKAQTQDMYPLSKTPLRYLLADRIDLTSDNLVSEMRTEPDLISLTIVERSRFAEGSLTLIFDQRTYQLRQWVVTDAQGLNTSVAIYNTATGKRQDRSMFRIDPRAFK
ncbi:MAG: LolA family protein [Alphaproteobacteria bacterium]